MGDLRQLVRKIGEAVENFQTGHKRSGADAVDAASVVAKFFDRAEDYIYLVPCEAEKQNIYQDPRVITALRGAVDRGASIKILVGPSGDPKAVLQSLDPRRSRKLEVRMLPKEKIAHFAVIDRRSVRVEVGIHRLSGTSVADVWTTSHSDTFAILLESSFEEMWEQAAV